MVRDDLAYSAMLTFLPVGLLGMVVASLAAAYMSTISTHLNWGASYLVHDVWRRFVKPEAGEKELVRVGRIATVLLMACSGALALLLENALQAFQILLQIGAGTGLLFLLRWFWWRVNALAELSAMVASFLIAIYFELLHPTLFGAPLPWWQQLATGVALTTVVWLLAAFFGAPTDEATLRHFYRTTRPGGPGWRQGGGGRGSGRRAVAERSRRIAVGHPVRRARLRGGVVGALCDRPPDLRPPGRGAGAFRARRGRFGGDLFRLVALVAADRAGRKGDRLMPSCRCLAVLAFALAWAPQALRAEEFPRRLEADVLGEVWSAERFVKTAAPCLRPAELEVQLRALAAAHPELKLEEIGRSVCSGRSTS